MLYYGYFTRCVILLTLFRKGVLRNAILAVYTVIEMKILDKNTPWYAAGLAFECQHCGRCCSGPEEGYVWVKKSEVVSIAEFLGMTVEQVHEKYLCKAGRRYSIKERPDNKDCVFLQVGEDETKTCRIYPVRPTQCRTWPFWPNNISSPQAWSHTQRRCPGINRGEVLSCEQIKARARATR